MIVSMDPTSASGRFFITLARYSRCAGRVCRQSATSARTRYAYSTSSNSTDASPGKPEPARRIYHADISISEAPRSLKRIDARAREIRNKIKDPAFAYAILDESLDDTTDGGGPPYEPNTILQRTREAMRKSAYPVAIVTSCSAEHKWPFPAMDVANSPAIVQAMGGQTQETGANRASRHLSPYFGSFCGATISSFTTVTMGPPVMISLNLKRPSRTLDGLLKHGYFRVHLMGATQGAAKTAMAFVKDFEPMSDKNNVAITEQGRRFKSLINEDISSNPWISLAARKVWTGLKTVTHEARQNPEAHYALAPEIGPAGGVRRHIYCRVHKDKCIEVGDHTIVVGEILHVSHAADPSTKNPPGGKYSLLYAAGEYLSRGSPMVLPTKSIASTTTTSKGQRTEADPAKSLAAKLIEKSHTSSGKIFPARLATISQMVSPLEATSLTQKVIRYLHKAQHKTGLGWYLPSIYRFIIAGYHLDHQQASTVCIATALGIQVMMQHEQERLQRGNDTVDDDATTRPMSESEPSRTDDSTSIRHTYRSIKKNLDFRLIRIDEKTLQIAKRLLELPDSDETPLVAIGQLNEMAKDPAALTDSDVEIDGRKIGDFVLDETCLVGVDRLLRKTSEGKAWEDLQEGLEVNEGEKAAPVSAAARGGYRRVIL